MSRSEIDVAVNALLCKGIVQLRDALIGTSTIRQFGLCWCDTISGMYCVGQPQCRDAHAALIATDYKNLRTPEQQDSNANI